jgi:transmembrane sensor
MSERYADDREPVSQAAGWLSRLQADDLTPQEATAFDAWLSAEPANVRAYDAALQVCREIEANAGALESAVRARRRARDLRTRRVWLSAGALAAAAVAVAVVLPQIEPAAEPLSAVTATGGRRTLDLADGSRIEMNATTRLQIDLERDVRRVTLTEGQAVFDVARDPRRPFVIAAGDRDVRVLGTEFDVRRRAGKLSVTVARGVVEVWPADGAGGRAFRLKAGQRLDHQEGAVEARVVTASPEEVLGWRSGRLIYRDRPLSEVVADLNQQFERPVTIADPALADISVSGVLVLDDQDAVLRRLALLGPIEAVRSETGVTLRRNDARR